ncbi:MAG: tripartite tricarboxylate transporter substrate binding protein [Betaproteobacteria bacterium]|nr:tripartite tricarboxylate transporter substrate binding protein [Betaproteobacteria bacterium]
MRDGIPENAFQRTFVTLARFLVAFALAGFSVAGWAQAYPNKSVRIIVPNGPGGPVDSVTRILGPGLSSAWGQPVLIENRAGAGGNIGADAVARATPDGYTLMITPSAPIVVNLTLFGSLPFDPIKDFIPVTMIYATPVVLTVPASLPVNSVSELIAYIKSRPGKLNYSSGGSGTAPHIAAEMFKSAADLDVVHVPYKTGGEMTTAVVTGDVAFSFNGLLVMPLVRAGKMKVLGVATLQRTALAPELPTFVESGLKDFEVSSWGGLFVPARTPAEVVSRLHADVTKLLTDPGIRSRMAAVGVEAVGNSSAAFAEQIRTESVSLARIIKSAGMKAQ